VGGKAAEPSFAVYVDEKALTEDLSHASEAARKAIGPVVEFIRTAGVPVGWLKRCEAEGRDGTRLPGCVKFYIPHPAGPWGAVLTAREAAVSPTLLLLAVGQRHPTAPFRPSVYAIAHRRLND
jgi:hypothetical protein